MLGDLWSNWDKQIVVALSDSEGTLGIFVNTDLEETER